MRCRLPESFQVALLLPIDIIISLFRFKIGISFHEENNFIRLAISISHSL